VVLGKARHDAAKTLGPLLQALSVAFEDLAQEGQREFLRGRLDLRVERGAAGARCGR
jgi:hypothetical protein